MQRDQTLFNKQSFLSKVYLFTIAVSVCYILSSVWHPMPEFKLHLLCVFALSLGLGYALLRYKRLVPFLAHYHMSVCYIVICINASITGGIAAPGMIWLLMCPLVSFLTVSFTVSTIWLIVVILTVVVFYFFDQTLVIAGFSGEKHWHLMANVLLFTVVYFILKSFRAKVITRTKELLRVNTLLEQNQRELELSQMELSRQHKLLKKSRLAAIARSQKLANYLNQHLEVSRMEEIHTGSLQYAIKSIQNFLLKALEIDRALIWQVVPVDGCVKIFNASDDQKIGSSELQKEDLADAFEMLESGAIVVTGNNDPASQQLKSQLGYAELEEVSVIACPFFIEGKLAGFFTCESHELVWSEEDIIFIRAISDTISLAFKSQQRTLHLQKIQEANELLEEKVKERTIKLDYLNQKLTDIAFTNAHIIRGPICRLAGLNNLLNVTPDQNEKALIVQLMGAAIGELNQISTNTSRELNELEVGSGGKTYS